MIVDSQHAISSGSKKRVTSRVALLMLSFEMLRAIDLYDQPRIVTDKVDNEGANWNLSPKTRTIQPVGAHRVPDDSLSVRQISPQRP
jgi:hypothetical protein